MQKPELFGLLGGFFFEFDFVPHAVKLFERAIFHLSATVLDCLFHGAKTAVELEICLVQRHLGIYLVEAQDVDHRKEQIACLFLSVSIVCGFELLAFFNHFAKASSTQSQSKPTFFAFFCNFSA